MTIIGPMLLGMGIMAAGYAIFVLVKNAVALVKQLIKAMIGVGELVQTNKQIVSVGVQVVTELQMLRSIFAASAPTPQVEVQTAAGVSAGRTGPGMAPFPPPIWDNFVPVKYEAEPDETEVIETTDAQFVEQERIEGIRELGFEPEVDEPQPWVVKDQK
jgi:hypothetical protein